MSYLAVGDLVREGYYQNGKAIRFDGGASRFNVIANLSAQGEKTKVISACGTDLAGDIALNGLKKVGVDTTDVIREGSTRMYHIIAIGDRHECKKKCPFCGESTWHDTPKAGFDYCISRMDSKDILILDGLKNENIPFITATLNEKVLDIGRIKRLEPLPNDILLFILKNKIEILQLNETVANYLLMRFGVGSFLDLFLLFRPKLMVVTKGKRGADFIYEEQLYEQKLPQSKVATEIDDTGAGDAFFSVVIREYYNNSKKVNKTFINSCFKKATELTTQVVSYVGARGHLYDGYCKENMTCICHKL